MAVIPSNPDNSAEPKQINELPDVANPGAQLAGSYIEVEVPTVVGPNQPPSYVNKRLAFGALVQVLRGATASGNDQKGTQPRIVLYESSATAGAGPTDSTLDRLSAAALCVGVEAWVLYPQPHALTLAADPTGPLTVAVDGNFSGPTTKARWVDAEDVAASGVPAYSPLKAEYALGEQVNQRVQGKLSLFAATKLLRRVDFPGNLIPAPTGVAGDENWEPLGYDAPGAAYVGFQRITPGVARTLASDEGVRENRLYRLFRFDKINEVPLPDVLVLGLSATQFSPTAWLLPLDGSAPVEGTFVLGATGQGDFTARADGGPSGPGYTDAQADARIAAARGATVASLVSGKVPAAQLPSYVDDVLEYATVAALPATGEVGKIYVITSGADVNKQYRWSGSAYVLLVASPGSTDAVPEGSTNKYFTAARVLATALTGYAKAATARAITAADSILTALGLLEKRLSQTESMVRFVSDDPYQSGLVLEAPDQDGRYVFSGGDALYLSRENNSGPATPIAIIDANSFKFMAPNTEFTLRSADGHGGTLTFGNDGQLLVNGAPLVAGSPAPLNRITFPFPPGQTTTYESNIVFLEMAGTYAVESQNGVKLSDPAPVYTVNGALANPPLNVVVGDTIAVTAATPAGVKGYLVLRSQ